MKTKFLTLFYLLAIMTLLFNSCEIFRGNGSVTTDNDVLCMDYKNAARSELDYDLVHEMTRLYQNNLGDDVIAVRFGLEEVKKFIYHLEMAAKKQNISSQNLGIRIYYARYPKKETWEIGNVFAKDLSQFLGNSITEQYPMKHTLIMIPTKQVGNVDEDYNPFAKATSVVNSTYTLNKALGAETSNPPIFSLAGNSEDNQRQNHGNMYPPYSTTGMTFKH